MTRIMSLVHIIFVACILTVCMRGIWRGRAGDDCRCIMHRWALPAAEVCPRRQKSPAPQGHPRGNPCKHSAHYLAQSIMVVPCSTVQQVQTHS